MNLLSRYRAACESSDWVTESKAAGLFGLNQAKQANGGETIILVCA